MRHVRFLLVIVLMMVTVAACAADKDDLQVKKQPELEQIKPKKPVKIKLRRSPRDEYTWELSGDDADEIVKTDRKLRKMLNVP
jgi:predicted secreted protein